MINVLNPCETLMRDRDGKYTSAFDNVFKSTDREIKLTPIRSPNLQAHVEWRAIQNRSSMKSECVRVPSGGLIDCHVSTVY